MKSGHTIQPIEVRVNGSKALAVSIGSVNARFAVSGVEYDCVSWVRFVSRLEKPGEEWKITTLEAIYDKDSIAPTKPGVGTEELDIDTKCPRASYKFLAWVLEQRGYRIAYDLPGTDDEESVQKCLDAGYNWLKGH